MKRPAIPNRLLRHLVLLFLICPFAAYAIETKRLDEMNPTEAQLLDLSAHGSVNSGTTLGRFILGGWPPNASTPPPDVPRGLAIVQGMREDGLWANAFLLRLEPASYPWLSNLSAHTASRYDQIGSGRILISFDQPICAIGAVYAQTGAHNPHHPDLRKRTSFYFYAEDGSLIDNVDQKPGHFIVQTAFGRQVEEPPIWAISIDSEVSFAVMELAAMECAILLG